MKPKPITAAVDKRNIVRCSTVIEAEATAGSSGINVDQRRASVATADLPESVFRYVLRTRESVLLHDASSENAFSSDEYIRKHHPRSVLCLPILRQTRLLGMLYLENKLTAHAFTPARMSVLKLLASGAAISMENARLYRDLAEREADEIKRDRELNMRRRSRERGRDRRHRRKVEVDRQRTEAGQEREQRGQRKRIR